MPSSCRTRLSQADIMVIERREYHLPGYYGRSGEITAPYSHIEQTNHLLRDKAFTVLDFVKGHAPDCWNDCDHAHILRCIGGIDNTHHCGACNEYLESGALPKWRCELCEHYPTWGVGVKCCWLGPPPQTPVGQKCPPRLEPSSEDPGWALIAAHWRVAPVRWRETWRGALPCERYRKRGLDDKRG